MQYLQDLNSKIETALTEARSNVTLAQTKMKYYFDQHSSERTLKAEELVLVLKPTCGNKLLAKWMGPYRVLKSMENNNYLIKISPKCSTKMHINSLRKFYTDNTGAPTNIIINYDDEGLDTDYLALDGGDGRVISKDGANSAAGRERTTVK